jgi:hypothetical protein
VLTLNACRSAPAYQATGYETDAGYMQPDHTAFYYWVVYHTTFGYYQPSVTYHVYVPPAGYPATYRPWYRASGTAPLQLRRSTASPNTRTGGGFSGTTSTPVQQHAHEWRILGYDVHADEQPNLWRIQLRPNRHSGSGVPVDRRVQFVLAVLIVVYVAVVGRFQ